MNAHDAKSAVARAGLEVALQRFAILAPLSDKVEWIDSTFACGPHYLKVHYKVR